MIGGVPWAPWRMPPEPEETLAGRMPTHPGARGFLRRQRNAAENERLRRMTIEYMLGVERFGLTQETIDSMKGDLTTSDNDA
jgi:hypothetical protein